MSKNPCPPPGEYPSRLCEVVIVRVERAAEVARRTLEASLAVAVQVVAMHGRPWKA